MNETKKHCNTCKYSYTGIEKSEYAEYGFVLVQQCSSTEYNSADYTNEMLMEDWGRGHCRFWAPKIRD